MTLQRVMTYTKSRAQTGVAKGLRLVRRAKSFAAHRYQNEPAITLPKTENVRDLSIWRVTMPSGEPAWLTPNYAQVKALLCDTRLQIYHPEHNYVAHISNAAIEQCRPESLRKLLAPSFSAHRLQGLRPRVREIVRQALDNLEHSTKPADFHALVSMQVPTRVICELVGIPYQDHRDLVQWSTHACDITDQQRSEAGLARLLTYFNHLIDQKTLNPAADVLSEMIATWERNSETIPGEDLAPVAAFLLFAGHRSTIAAIDKGIVLLLRDLALWERLRGDRTLIPSACEEIFRLPWPTRMRTGSQIGGIARYSHADFQIGEQDVHKGDVMLLGAHGNLDPEVFPNPFKFDLARKGTPHLTFGHGAHYCLGAPLARIELQILIEHLVLRFPGLESDLLVPPLLELPVTW